MKNDERIYFKHPCLIKYAIIMVDINDENKKWVITFASGKILNDHIIKYFDNSKKAEDFLKYIGYKESSRYEIKRLFHK